MILVLMSMDDNSAVWYSLFIRTSLYLGIGSLKFSVEMVKIRKEKTGEKSMHEHLVSIMSFSQNKIRLINGTM